MHETVKKENYLSSVSFIALLLLTSFTPLIVSGQGLTSPNTNTISKTISSETYTVNLRQQSYVRLYVDASAQEDNLVEGSISVAGGQINFYVFDEDGWNAYEDYDPASMSFMGPDPNKMEQDYYESHFSCYVYAKFVSSYQFSFVPKHTDHYFFVFDHRYNNDWLSNKQVTLNAVWVYSNPTSEPSTSNPQETDGPPIYYYVAAFTVGILAASAVTVLLWKKRKRSK